MKPDKQRIAIAEACGWKKYGDAYPSFDTGEYVQWWKKEGDCGEVGDLPNYLSDLNVMHEAEKTLTAEQWVSYWSFLEPISCRPHNTPIIFATAAQRAEAFLKTLNLWTE